MNGGGVHQEELHIQGRDGSVSKAHLALTVQCWWQADPVLPGETHEHPVVWSLGHIPPHATVLVEKQGIGPAPICREDGLVGIGLEVGERQTEMSLRDLRFPPWCLPHL